MIVTHLSRRFDRVGFTCGTENLDSYLRTQALQDVKNRIAACYVLTESPESEQIAGYYTFSAGVIELCSIPESARKRLPRYPQVPTILIGRIAVAEERQGKGVGRALLFDALQRAVKMSDQLGAWAVVVDAKDGGVSQFYQKHGFKPILSDPLRLFLPLKTARLLVSE